MEYMSKYELHLKLDRLFQEIKTKHPDMFTGWLSLVFGYMFNSMDQAALEVFENHYKKMKLAKLKRLESA